MIDFDEPPTSLAVILIHQRSSNHVPCTLQRGTICGQQNREGG
jgi:hypothetical protein